MPAGANTYTGTRAVVAATIGSAKSIASFTVRRDPVEAYVFPTVVHVGQPVKIELVGSRKARIGLLFLVPDGHFNRESVGLDAHGRAVYTYHVPSLRKTGTLIVIATVPLRSGSYASTAYLRIR